MTIHSMESGKIFGSKVKEQKRLAKTKKREQHFGSKTAVFRLLRKYADVTTGHGIAYICENEGSIFTRTLWAIIVLVSIVLSSVLAYNAYVAWKDDPILTTIKNTGLSIKNIQFPAVTLCYQGNIKQVTANVIEMQWKEYLKEIRNTTLQKIEGEKISYFRDYLKYYFNSSDISLAYVVKMIKAANPEASARTAIALGTMNPCDVNKIKIFDSSEENNRNNFSSSSNSSEIGCPYNFDSFSSLPVCTYTSYYTIFKQDLVNECGINGGSAFQIESSEDIKILDTIRSNASFHYYYETPFFLDMTTTQYEIQLIKAAIQDYKDMTLLYEDIGEGYCMTFRIGYYQNVTFEPMSCVSKQFVFCVKYISECSAGLQKLNNIEAVEQLLSPALSRQIESLQGIIKNAVEKFFTNLNHQKSYGKLMELLWLDKLPCFDNKLISVSFLRRCWWKDREIPCVSLFDAVPTDRGICCAFNLEKAEDMYRTSVFSKTLSQLQGKDRKLSQLPPQLPPDWERNKEPFPSDGKRSGLKIMLDANSYLIDSSTLTSDETGFYAYVDGKRQFPIISRKSVPIMPNRHNYVAISAYDVVSDTQLRDISPEKRNCYFHDEYTLKYFKNYTRNNCLFECNVEYGLRNVSCVPWYFPKLNNKTKTCSPWNAKKFTQSMSNVNEEECDCKPDCDVTVYTSSVSTLDFNRCTLKNLGLSYFCDFMRNDLPSPQIFGEDIFNRDYQDPSITSRLKSIFKTNSRLDDEYLSIYSEYSYDGSIHKYDAYEKDIAMVNFYFDSSAISQYARQKKLTTIEFISQIGGLLGLFIGFSIISFIELAYWFIYKMFFTAILKKRN